MNKLNYLLPWIREAERKEIEAIRLCESEGADAGIWPLQEATMMYKRALWGLEMHPNTKQERELGREIKGRLEIVIGRTIYLLNIITQQRHF